MVLKTHLIGTCPVGTLRSEKINIFIKENLVIIL